MIRPCLPTPRGVLSEFVIDRLRSPDAPLGVPAVWRSGDPLTDDDFALALYVAYELHYRGFAGVDDGLEWHPGLLTFRAALERAFLDRLYEECLSSPGTGDVEADLSDLLARAGGPALSAYMEQHGTLAEIREFRGAPLRLPIEGSRPAHLGDPAPRGLDEGGADPDPGRRVRLRRDASDAPAAVRRHDARAGA